MSESSARNLDLRGRDYDSVMDTFNALAGVASIASLTLAIVLTLRDRKRRTITESAVSEMQERIRAVNLSIRGAGTTADELVRLSHDGSTQVEALRSMAKALRTQIYQAGAVSDEAWEKLSEWRFGKMLSSQTPVASEVKSARLDMGAEGEAGPSQPTN